VPGRKGDDQFAMNERQGAALYDQTAIAQTRECSDLAFDLCRIANVDPAQPHPKRRRRGRDRVPLADPGGYRGIPKNRRSLDARCELLE
jgi:hypothetical protein